MRQSPRKLDTGHVPWRHFCSVVTFYWLTRFVDSFVNFDWLDLVIYFHTNELVNKTLLWSTFQTTAIYDEVLREVWATFGIETFREEQQKAIDLFSGGNDVSVSLPTSFRKSFLYRIFNISPLFSRWNRPRYLSRRPLKISQKTRYTILVSAFNFRSLCERCFEYIKLKLVVSCSVSFDWKKSRSIFTLAA